jgi:hypothetical protein
VVGVHAREGLGREHALKVLVILAARAESADHPAQQSTRVPEFAAAPSRFVPMPGSTQVHTQQDQAGGVIQLALRDSEY